MNWIRKEEHLPIRKNGWEHSEQVLVWYGEDKYGIAYYHYGPPFAEPGFIDFANYGRQPIAWTDIAHPINSKP